MRSVSVPWEHPWNNTSSPPSSDSTADSTTSSDSGSESVSDVEMMDDPTGQYLQHYEVDSDNEDDSDDEDDQDDQDYQAQPLQAVLQDVAQGAPSLPAGPLLPEFNIEQLIFDELDLDIGQTHFPSDSEAADSELLGSELTDDPSFVRPNNEPPPEIAPYRLNLTALSQRYNMYAVAYADEIHIYRVTDCVKHSIGCFPDYVLKPPSSDDAFAVGGYIDTSNPHRMNHLVIGDLGEEEVLLVAFDDGDVLGYYSAHIDKTISSVHADKFDHGIVKPFFHENVGRSAWGLAVHKQSRLIAVGANNHQVHVFALALTDLPRTSPEEDVLQLYERDLYLPIRVSADGIVEQKPISLASEIDLGPDNLKRRERSYQFIFEIGWRGNNIPNVAFSSNADGDAAEVLAVDISGKLWVIDLKSCLDTPHRIVDSLYKVHEARTNPQTHLNNFLMDNNVPRGWGVLVLPESSFLPTSTYQESLGLSPEEAVYVNNVGYGYYIGTGRAVGNIKDNSLRHPWVKAGQLGRFRSVPARSDWTLRKWYDTELDCNNNNWSASHDEAVEKSSKRVSPSRHRMNDTGNVPAILNNGSSVMRTYELDVELVGGDLDNVGIMFKNVIRQARPTQSLLPQVPFAPERLSNLLHVPELYLVVAGSQCGRVALITLTRPSNPCYSFQRGFKVEAILPRRVEEDCRLRPMCFLLGVAIGPIPSQEGGKAQGGRYLGDRRYRIMLHYYDHSILSYEVYRNMLTSELFVI